MKLLEYKKQHSGDLELVGEKATNSVRTNHTYNGDLSYVHAIDCGPHLFLIKNEDIELFRNGKKEISVCSIETRRNYTGKGSMALAHTLSSYANGLYVDELEVLLKEYAEGDYSIMTAANYGMFFAYTDYNEGKDYSLVSVKENDIMFRTISFHNADMKEQFDWELHEVFSVHDVLDEINALHVSKDVLFVHHEDGVGYAARDLNTLSALSGFIYQNFLIV